MLDPTGTELIRTDVYDLILADTQLPQSVHSSFHVGIPVIQNFTIGFINKVIGLIWIAHRLLQLQVVLLTFAPDHISFIRIERLA